MASKDNEQQGHRTTRAMGSKYTQDSKDTGQQQSNGATKVMGNKDGLKTRTMNSKDSGREQQLTARANDDKDTG
jgi:hypothetical protein